MGTDHGKKIKTPLRKPKAIDEIGKKKEPAFDVMKEFNKTMENFKKFEQERKAKKASKKAKESSKKTTITDTQKRGQLGLRYDLFEGTKKPLKKPTAKKVSPGSKSRKQSRDNRQQKSSPKTQPKNFLPHIIKPLFMYPEGEKPKFLRKKTSGEA